MIKAILTGVREHDMKTLSLLSLLSRRGWLANPLVRSSCNRLVLVRVAEGWVYSPVLNGWVDMEDILSLIRIMLARVPGRGMKTAPWSSLLPRCGW